MTTYTYTSRGHAIEIRFSLMNHPVDGDNILGELFVDSRWIDSYEWDSINGIIEQVARTWKDDIWTSLDFTADTEEIAPVSNDSGMLYDQPSLEETKHMTSKLTPSQERALTKAYEAYQKNQQFPAVSKYVWGNAYGEVHKLSARALVKRGLLVEEKVGMFCITDAGLDFINKEQS